MNLPPIITAKRLAGALTLADYAPQIVPFDYCDGVIPYTACLKVTKNPDGLFVMCCACGCLARQLFKHPTRIGLCCTDCRNRAEHRADAPVGRISTRKPPAKKTVDEVAALLLGALQAATNATPEKSAGSRRAAFGWGAGDSAKHRPFAL